jgi:biopolymer transport protein ExbD
MSHSRKHKRKQEGVKLNLAAMLDMAFQLLAFFILTFKPAPVEGQVNLRLPPAQPVVVNNGKSAGADTKSTDPLKGLNSLVISIYARPDGTINTIQVLDASLNNLPQAEKRIHAELAQKGSVLDQVALQIDSKLKYEELMKVVDVCTRAKLPDNRPLAKLTFVELPSQ